MNQPQYRYRWALGYDHPTTVVRRGQVTRKLLEASGHADGAADALAAITQHANTYLLYAVILRTADDELVLDWDRPTPDQRADTSPAGRDILRWGKPRTISTAVQS